MLLLTKIDSMCRAPVETCCPLPELPLLLREEVDTVWLSLQKQFPLSMYIPELPML